MAAHWHDQRCRTCCKSGVRHLHCLQCRGHHSKQGYTYLVVHCRYLPHRNRRIALNCMCMSCRPTRASAYRTASKSRQSLTKAPTRAAAAICTSRCSTAAALTPPRAKWKTATKPGATPNGQHKPLRRRLHPQLRRCSLPQVLQMPTRRQAAKRRHQQCRCCRQRLLRCQRRRRWQAMRRLTGRGAGWCTAPASILPTSDGMCQLAVSRLAASSACSAWKASPRRRAVWSVGVAKDQPSFRRRAADIIAAGRPSSNRTGTLAGRTPCILHAFMQLTQVIQAVEHGT